MKKNKLQQTKIFVTDLIRSEHSQFYDANRITKTQINRANKSDYPELREKCPHLEFFWSIYFFSIWFFFHERSQFAGQQVKGETIPFIPLFRLPPLRRHLDITWTITAESSLLHITSNPTWTGSLWFPSASC